MDDDHSPWPLPDDPSHESWRPEMDSLSQPEGVWSALPDQDSGWGIDEQQQPGPEFYRRQDMFQLPGQIGQFPIDPFQQQVAPEGLLEWQPGTQRDPRCMQHGYQPHPGFAGYPGNQDSQGYQVAPSNPLFEQQKESNLFSDSRPALTTDDDDLNTRSLDCDLCHSLGHGFASGRPIEDEDDEHPPGSQLDD